MRKGLKRFGALLIAGVLVSAAFAGCGNSGSAASSAAGSSKAAGSSAAGSSAAGSAAGKTITVAATPTPHGEILAKAKEILAKDGITLDIKEFTDYVQPNNVVDAGEIDCNYFQHQPYLDDFNAKNKTKLVSIAAIHYEPLGIYAGKTKAIADLKDGATIAVPNDSTNEARALLLLEANGIIKLKDGAGVAATVQDIVENKKNIKVMEFAAEQVSRHIDEVDLVVLNGNYALNAGLNASKDALTIEAADSAAAKTYANVIVVKEGNEKNDAINALVKVLKSDEIKTYIKDSYKGAVVPMD
ncbi:MAG: MetQ/NlpA family ABC transporter substrate-binding protein [Lachnospiraceae bacterium]|nr:MetQ/NlpA family ABC transporter substrate-binding protein [Lachnospiraceae bacterium]